MSKSRTSLERRYLIYRVLTSMWFLSAVWLYFYRIFITDQQIGLLDGMAFAIGILAEVPSGALADSFGKSRILKVGLLLSGLGIITQGLGSSFGVFFVGQATMMVGVSFISGADEALFYEKAGFDKESKDWRNLVTRGTQVSLIANLIAIVSGGWLHTVNPRIPWLLTGILPIIAMLFIWSLKDERVERDRQLSRHINNIIIGFKQFARPELRIYLPIILTVQGLFYAAGFGLLRLVLLDRFGFSPLVGSFVVAACSLLTAGLMTVLYVRSEKINEKLIISLISVTAVASLLASLLPIGYFGGLVVLALYAGEYLLRPFMSEILNKHAPEKQRATVLSVATFIKSLPYVALGPAIGYLNGTGRLGMFLVGWSVVMAMSLIYYLNKLKRPKTVSVDH